MFDAPDENSVAILDPLAAAWSMHIVKCQLEPGQQEHIEHVDRLAHRQMKLGDESSEPHDQRPRLVLLGRPIAIEGHVGPQIANGSVVWEGLEEQIVDGDSMQSDFVIGDRTAIRTSSNQLALVGVQLHLVESQKVLHPSVLYLKVFQPVGQNGGVVRVPQRSQFHFAFRKKKFAPVADTSEGIDPQPVV